MKIVAWMHEGKLWCTDAIMWMRIWRTLPILAWLKAASAFKKGKYHESAEYYRRGLLKYKDHPAHFSACYDLAFCLEKVGEYEQAIDVLSEIVSARHPFLEAYQNMALLLNYLGKYGKSLEVLRVGRSIFPEDITLMSLFCHIALNSGLSLEEIKLVKKELKSIRNNSVDISNSDILKIDSVLAHYELVKGDPIIGDRILIRVVSSDTPPVEALLVRGKRLLTTGRLFQARELFRRAMIRRPCDPNPLIMLCETYLMSGYSNEKPWAIQLAETACRISKWKNPEAVEVLSRAYEKNNEEGKAELLNEKLRNMSQAIHLPFIKKGKAFLLKSTG